MIQHDFAEVNGIKLHYAHAGSGPLLLFAHGFPEFWYAWRRQLEEFSRTHRVVAPDLRGYNLSSKPKEVRQYELPQIIADLRGLARHLGYERFTLVGHDWGGVACWTYAMAHPEDLERLIIINSPHPAVFRRELRENESQRRASRYMLFFRSRVAEPALSAFRYAALVRTVLSNGLKRGYFNKEDRARYIEAWSQPGALTGGLNWYRAARVGPPQDEKDKEAVEQRFAALPDPTVRVPTLVIWGEQDRYLLTGCLNELDQYVPKLQVRRVPDATHWIHHEQPQLVTKYIREFLAADAAQGAAG